MRGLELWILKCSGEHMRCRMGVTCKPVCSLIARNSNVRTLFCLLYICLRVLVHIQLPPHFSWGLFLQIVCHYFEPRLVTWLEDNGLRAACQAGFRPKCEY